MFRRTISTGYNISIVRLTGSGDWTLNRCHLTAASMNHDLNHDYHCRGLPYQIHHSLRRYYKLSIRRTIEWPHPTVIDIRGQSQWYRLYHTVWYLEVGPAGTKSTDSTSLNDSIRFAGASLAPWRRFFNFVNYFYFESCKKVDDGKLRGMCRFLLPSIENFFRCGDVINPVQSHWTLSRACFWGSEWAFPLH